jgi:hypothetical protein
MLFVIGSANAQKIEGTANVAPGDKLTYKFTFGGNSVSFQKIITSVTPDEIKGEIVILDRKMEFQGQSMGVLSKEISVANGQAVKFKTPVKMYDANTALNDKWENTFTADLDSFSVDMKSQHKADKFEKIKLQFNEINALRISQSGTIQGKQNEKEFRGTESSKYWIGVINGVQLMLRREYQNSFGDKTIIELTDAQLTGAK